MTSPEARFFQIVRRSRTVQLLKGYLALEWQAHLVVIFAALAMTYVQVVQPFHWPGSDALNDLQEAWYILNRPGGTIIPWHPPGMAVFHILSGVAWADTFKVLIVLYAAMSATIPMVMYATLRRYSRNAALAAALIATFSAVPYGHSKVGLSDQLFFFLHFCVLAVVAAYFANPRSKTLPYTICLGLCTLNLVRPVAALYYWIFFVSAIILVRRWLFHVAMATVIYVGLMGGWALADRHWGGSSFPTVYAPGTVAQRLFGEIYFSGAQYQFVPELPPVPSIKPEDGPASAKMYEVLRWFAGNQQQTWTKPNTELPYLLFGRFADDPEELVQQVTRKPNFAYFNFLRMALQAKLGTQAETLMRQVAAEHHNTGWRGTLSYFARNPTKLLIGGTPSFAGRNLLGIFYFLRTRQATNRIYSLSWGIPVPKALLDTYIRNPTPEGLDQIFKKDTSLEGLNILHPENGPASREFFRAVHFFIKAYPVYWENANPWLSRYKGRPDDFFQEISYPSNPYDAGIYEGIYWDALIKYYGIGPANRLLTKVALETMRTHPFSVALFSDNILHITLIRSIGNVRSQSIEPRAWFRENGPILYDVRENDFTALPPGLRKELTPVILATPYTDAIGIAYSMMHLMAPAFVIASLVLFSFILLGPARRFGVFLAIAYAYNVAVIAVFGNFGAPRYEDVFILLPVMLTCMGAHFARQTLKQWRRDDPDRG